jgi:hypothetical protein
MTENPPMNRQQRRKLKRMLREQERLLRKHDHKGRRIIHVTGKPKLTRQQRAFYRYRTHQLGKLGKASAGKVLVKDGIAIAGEQ